MAEDYRSYAEGAASRNPESGLGVYLRGRSLQPGADAESAGQPGWCRMSQGRSVPARGQSGQNEPLIEALTHFQRNLGCFCLQFGIKQVTTFLKTAFFQQTASRLL